MLGKTNVTELGGLFDANLPEGYSSLGGQVLLPSDTDKTPAGSSAGSRGGDGGGPRGADDRHRDLDGHGAADRAGRRRGRRRPQADGRRCVDRDGVLPDRQVAGRRRPDHPHGRRRGERVRGRCRASRSRCSAPALAARASRSSTRRRRRTRPRSPRCRAWARRRRSRRSARRPERRRASSRARSRSDLNAYLRWSGGAGSLQEIVDYNTANPVEGLKYQQRELTARAVARTSRRWTPTRPRARRQRRGHRRGCWPTPT